MGEDHRKLFWTSMLGILAGIASVIVALGGILTALHIGSPPPPMNFTSSSSLSTSSTSSASGQIPEACGTKQLGINKFGKWKWVGTNNGSTQSGITTFKSDCTYTSIATSGLTVNTNGHFNISSSPTTTIKLQNNLGKEPIT